MKNLTIYEDKQGNSCLFNLLLVLLLGVSAYLLYWLVSEFKTIMLLIFIVLLIILLTGVIYHNIKKIRKKRELYKRKKLSLSTAPDDTDFTVDAPNPDDELLIVEDSPRPTMDLPSYKYPTLDLLKRYDQEESQVDMAEQNENKNTIIQTLENFGIKIKSIKATVGPTVTLYEIVPEDGVRITKIRNLEDDIAMNLAALGIRIIAPMPGKGTVGIEVPNKKPQIVSIRSVIASKKFQETDMDLPIALGRTITNEVFMVDLTKAPHLLVAGAASQGKSACLNAAITSLLYKKHPAELKFVLIDPKTVEFGIYSAIEKHFLAKLPDAEKSIVTHFAEIIRTLNSLVKEMDNRHELMEKAGCSAVKEYNEKYINKQLNIEDGHRFMPYIVVIIDEFGDLMMTAGEEIELPIARIAQKARAVGIHMIIATQRPTVSIITGTIKANFPARIAFKVFSQIDSRTILDTRGADQLVGRGDMLYTQGYDMIRIQCAFADTPEVEKISKFISGQQGYPIAYLLPEYVQEKIKNEITTDKNKPITIELSKDILDMLSDNDIIYAEIAAGGAMGYAGQAMLYIIEEEKLICYKTNLFTDENTYMQVTEILAKHRDVPFPIFGDVDNQADNSKSQFNYYYGGVGNHVFVNKDVSLKIVDNHFVYEENNKEYRIFSSVLGVFDSVVDAMQNAGNKVKAMNMKQSTNI